MPGETPPPPVLTPATGALRLLLYAGGFALLGMAYLGAILPGLPTTPWVLGASYCFARTSPRLQRWLWYSPLFGPLIRDWYLHRGMRRRAKFVATAMMLAACTFSVTVPPLPDWVRIVIACCGLTGFCVIWGLVPTVRRDAPG